MATSKEYLDYILEHLRRLDKVTYKPMMGEYLLYYDGTLFGGIYDNRFLVKKTDSNKKYNLQESIPYEGAKAMYLVDFSNQKLQKDIIIDTYTDLRRKYER